MNKDTSNNFLRYIKHK